LSGSEFYNNSSVINNYYNSTLWNSSTQPTNSNSEKNNSNWWNNNKSNYYYNYYNEDKYTNDYDYYNKQVNKENNSKEVNNNENKNDTKNNWKTNLEDKKNEKSEVKNNNDNKENEKKWEKDKKAELNKKSNEENSDKWNNEEDINKINEKIKEIIEKEKVVNDYSKLYQIIEWAPEYAIWDPVYNDLVKKWKNIIFVDVNSDNFKDIVELPQKYSLINWWKLDKINIYLYKPVWNKWIYSKVPIEIDKVNWKPLSYYNVYLFPILKWQEEKLLMYLYNDNNNQWIKYDFINNFLKIPEHAYEYIYEKWNLDISKYIKVYKSILYYWYEFKNKNEIYNNDNLKLISNFVKRIKKNIDKIEVSFKKLKWFKKWIRNIHYKLPFEHFMINVNEYIKWKINIENIEDNKDK